MSAAISRTVHFERHSRRRFCALYKVSSALALYLLHYSQITSQPEVDFPIADYPRTGLVLQRQIRYQQAASLAIPSRSQHAL